MRWIAETLGGLRLRIALVVSAAVAVMAALPEFFLMAAWHRLAYLPVPVRRRRTGAWGRRWMGRFLRIAERIGGMDVNLHPVHRPTAEDLRHGAIVISNHHGGFDAPLISAILSEMGFQDVRTVAMREIRHLPPLDLPFCEAGCAYVGRKGDPRDLENVRRFGEACMEDGACALIFPEGHIWRGESSDGYRYVRRPRHRGLAEMIRAMPGRPIVSVTIRYRDWKLPYPSILGAIPPGRIVNVSAKIVRDVDPEKVEEWLRYEWKRKDAFLALDY